MATQPSDLLKEGSGALKEAAVSRKSVTIKIPDKLTYQRVRPR